MGALLLETVGGGVGAGFGAKAGFGFGWGNDAPIHAWTMWPEGYPYVGASFMSFGMFGKDWNNSMVSAGQCLPGIDYISQDQAIYGTGAITDFGSGSYVQAQNGTSDVILSNAVDNPVPVMFGGNACRIGVGGFFTGLTAYAGTFDPVSGNTAVTGVGFQPDLVIFVGASSAGVVSDDGLRMMVGMMDAAGNQWVCAQLGVFETGYTGIGGLFGYPVRMSEFRSDACTLALPDQYGAFSSVQDYTRGSFVSMDTDGFTIHGDVLATTYGGYRPQHLFMAIKVDDPTKAFFQVGTHVQGDTNLGSYPLDPEGVILCGDSWSTSIDGSPSPVWTDAPHSTRSVISLGGFDGILNRSTVGGAASGSTNPGMYYDDSALIFGDVLTSSILARALGTLGTATASLAWTADDGGARPFGSLAFRCPNRGFPMFDHRIPI